MSRFQNLGNDSISVTWSIGIEEQFYLIFPFLIYLIRKNWIPAVLGLLIIAAPILRLQFDNWIPPYVLLYCRMDALAFGILVAFIYEKGWVNVFTEKLASLMFGMLVLCIAICFFLVLRFNDLGVFRNTLFSIVFSIAILFSLSARNSWYKNLLRNGFLRWIRAISYSLYLFHYIILGLFHHFAGQRDGIGIYNIIDIWVSAGALIASILVAWIVYKKIESPMVRWGKKFVY